MFRKVLIANRGEIACRVVRTLRRMGIRSVAVFSDADARALHVRVADEAMRIGPPPARESYLDGGRIIAAAVASGAEAIHPGYGFLAENEHFAQACADAGLAFIGPPVPAIRAMGSKAAAKALMQAAGVPLVRGYHGDDQDASHLQREADAIGYPVLIKPSAGGGGKGMRAVERAADFAASLASAQREAASSFGDQRVLIETYVTRPRHIEIQVFADGHGNTVHVFERDCSVQRRHQKVLEEAPAPGMTDERRHAMGAAAVAAARAVAYTGAGTVEFIAEPSGRFFFMEMNTRLQVEHPVTEMITGLDLVEWQLRVAAGEPLPLTQEQLGIRGHALEARIYAEDPDKGFLPSTGKLVHLSPPAPSAHVRVDSGVEQGDEITPWYDPMIAKLIVWDEDRASACSRMLRALSDYRVVGVANNVEFLSRLVASPSFAQADLDTGLIEREHAHLFPPAGHATPETVFLVAAVARLAQEEAQARAEAAGGSDPTSPWHVRDGWRVNATATRTLAFRSADVETAVAVAYVPGVAGGYRLALDGKTTEARVELGSDSRLRIDLGGRRLQATAVVAGAKLVLFVEGQRHELTTIDPLHHGGEGAGTEGGLIAPMPGRVIALLVAPGARVEKGAPLLILEAMKMEHTIVAPAAGVVQAFCFAEGAQVTEGAELVRIDAEGAA